MNFNDNLICLIYKGKSERKKDKISPTKVLLIPTFLGICMLSFVTKNFKILNQSVYTKCILNINLNSITCSRCNHNNCFKVHAYYKRYIKVGPIKIKIKIARIICSHCGITHAILPYSIIPYTQRTLNDTIIIYDLLSSNASFNYGLIDDHPSISLSDLFILKRSFHLWEDVMASISLNDHPCNIFVSSFEKMNRNLSQARYKHTDFYFSF